MKARAVTLILLFLFPIFAGVGAATNEGYGEDQTSLGQIIDTFDTSDNISIAVDVIRNATIEAMQLNGTAGKTLVYEEIFYREHDSVPLKVPDFLWAIQGGDNIETTSDTASQGWGHTYVIANRASLAGLYLRWMWQGYYSGGVNRDPMKMYIMDYEWDRTNNTDFPESRNRGQQLEYYVSPGFTGWSGQLTVDYQLNNVSTGSNDNVSIAFTIEDRWASQDVKMRLYWLEINSGPGGAGNLALINFTTATNRVIEQAGTQDDYGYVNNTGLPVFIGGYENDGWFTTVNYLSGPSASGSALVAMVNTSIPTFTGIKLQFSNDTVVWTDEYGISGNSVDLLGEFEAIDLRNLNYSANIHFRGNLSTTDCCVTPVFNQIRLITTEGPTSFRNVTGEWIDYNFTSINTVIGNNTGGNTLNNTYWRDSITYNVSESLGAPGLNVEFNVSNLPDGLICLSLRNFLAYDGSAGHTFEVQAWNYTGSVWVTISDIPDSCCTWINGSLACLAGDFIKEGIFQGRYYHPSPGNVNHDFYLDYGKLRAFAPVESVTPTESFQFFWIVIAIALMLIGLVLSKMWFDGEDP